MHLIPNSMSLAMSSDQSPNEQRAALIQAGVKNPAELCDAYKKVLTNLDFLCENLMFAERTLKATFVATCNLIPGQERRQYGMERLLGLISTRAAACQAFSKIIDIDVKTFESVAEVLIAIRSSSALGDEAIQRYAEDRKEEINNYRTDRAKSVLDDILDKS